MEVHGPFVSGTKFRDLTVPPASPKFHRSRKIMMNDRSLWIKHMRIPGWTAAAFLALQAAACAPLSRADDPMARRATPPASEAAAQKAVTEYLPLWLNGATPVRYSFRPLATGAVNLGFGMREAGYFMCGTVDVRNENGREDRQRVFFAHFDPAQPDLADGAVGEGPTSRLVSGWCAQVYTGSTAQL
jgi:hypothetical protein